MSWMVHRAIGEKSAQYHIMHKSGIAFCTAYYMDEQPDCVSICNLSVSKDHRNKGLATEMVTKIIRAAKEAGAERVCLWVEEGSWMHEWYKRLGFEDVCSVSDNDRLDEVWMEKILI